MSIRTGERERERETHLSSQCHFVREFGYGVLTLLDQSLQAVVNGLKWDWKQHLLDPFVPHDVEYLRCSLFVQSRSWISTEDVIGLYVEILRCKSCIRLICEGRDGSVVLECRKDILYALRYIWRKREPIPVHHYQEIISDSSYAEIMKLDILRRTRQSSARIERRNNIVND